MKTKEFPSYNITNLLAIVNIQTLVQIYKFLEECELNI